jgi:hypothetical protein
MWDRVFPQIQQGANQTGRAIDRTGQGRRPASLRVRSLIPAAAAAAGTVGWKTFHFQHFEEFSELRCPHAHVVMPAE